MNRSYPSILRWMLAVMIISGLTYALPIQASHLEEIPMMSGFSHPNPYIEDIWVNRGFSTGLPWANQTLLVSAGTDAHFGQYRDGEDDMTAWGYVTVTLDTDFSGYDEVLFEFATRDTVHCAAWAQIYWDDVLIFEWVPKTSGDELIIHRIVVNAAKLGLDLSPGDHTIKLVSAKSGGIYDFAHLNSLRMSVASDSASSKMPVEVVLEGDSVGENTSWTLAWIGHDTTPVQHGVRLLTEQFERLVGERPQVVRTADLAESSIVLGDLSSPLLATLLADVALADAVSALNEDPLGEAQGYLLAVVTQGDRQIVIGGGLSPMGTAYAASDLTTRLVRDNVHAKLVLDGPVQVEIPDFEYRGVYLNMPLAYGVGKVMPNFWDDDDWQYFFDQLLLARINDVDFFFWFDGLAYPGVPEYDRNIAVHQQMQRAIKYAHERGIRVGYMFSPSLVPHHIYLENPSWQAVNPYPDPIINPGHPDAFAKMLEIYRNEIEWFREADVFHIWFYDPGGDFSEESKKTQADQLIKITRTFGHIAKEYNPDARIQVSTWPIWYLEPMYGLNYRDEFLVKLAELQSELGPIVIMDSTVLPESSVWVSRDYGLQPEGFIYETNIESGYFFVTPMLDVLRMHVRNGVHEGWHSIFFMHLEEGSKIAQTHFAGNLMWDASASNDEIYARYLYWLTGHQKASELLQKAFETLDRFVLSGAKEDLGQQMVALTEEALALLSPELQERLSWILTTMRGVQLVGQATTVAKGGATYTRIKAEFVRTLAQSPLFEPWSRNAYVLTLFDQYVDWLRAGWLNVRF